MHITKHFDARMQQRGIRHDMVNMVERYGMPRGDKIVLDKKGCRKRRSELLRELEAIDRIAARGGLTVVQVGESCITTYTLDQ